MNSFRGRSILTPFMMIMIILVWRDYPLAGKTKNEGERKKKKRLSKLKFRCNKSIKQSASVSQVLFSSHCPGCKEVTPFFTLPQWRWEWDSHSLPSVVKAERRFCRLLRHIPSPAVLSAAYGEANTSCNRHKDEEGGNRDNVVLRWVPKIWSHHKCEEGEWCVHHLIGLLCKWKGCRIPAHSFAFHISAAIRERWTVAAPELWDWWMLCCTSGLRQRTWSAGCWPNQHSMVWKRWMRNGSVQLIQCRQWRYSSKSICFSMSQGTPQTLMAVMISCCYR